MIEVFALEVAERLKKHNIEVNFLGMYDAVDMNPRPSVQSVPSNVRVAVHAVKTGSSMDRWGPLPLPLPTQHIPGAQERAFHLDRPSTNLRDPTWRRGSSHGDIGANPDFGAPHDWVIESAIYNGVGVMR